MTRSADGATRSVSGPASSLVGPASAPIARTRRGETRLGIAALLAVLGGLAAFLLLRSGVERSGAGGTHATALEAEIADPSTSPVAGGPDSPGEPSELSGAPSVDRVPVEEAPVASDSEGAPVRTVRGLLIGPDGYGVEGVRVDLWESLMDGPEVLGEFRLRGTSHSGDAGAFEVPVPAGSAALSLGFAHEEFVAPDLALPRELDEEHDVGGVLMMYGVGVFGTVRDPDEAPVAGAKLYLVHDRNHHRVEVQERDRVVATSAEDGSFETLRIPDGEQTLRVAAPGLADTLFEVVTGDAPREIHRDLRMRGLGEIEGRIVGLAGEPVSELSVVALAQGERFGDERRSAPRPPLRSPVAADGAFRIAGVPTDRDEDGGLEYSVFAVHAESPNLPFTAPVRLRAPAAGVELLAGGSFRVRVRAVLAETGNPVEDFEATLILHGDGYGSQSVSGRSREGGASSGPEYVARFPSPRQTAHLRVWATADGLVPTGVERMEASPDTRDLSCVVELAVAPTAQVRVVDAASGDAVPGAAIFASAVPTLASLSALADKPHISGGGHEVRALVQADGAGVLTLESGVEYEIYGESDAHAPCPVRRLPALGDGEQVELELELSRGGALDLQVLHPTGEPAAGASVAIRRIEDEPPPPAGERQFASMRWELEAGPSGRLQLERVPPGEYAVEPVLESELAATSSRLRLEVQEAQTTGATLTLPGMGAVLAAVRINGVPVEGATVLLKRSLASAPGPSALEADPDTLRSETDYTGRALFSDVPHGLYDIEAWDAASGVYASAFADHFQDRSSVTLEGSGGALRVRVLNGDGEPAVGCWVGVLPSEFVSLALRAQLRVLRRPGGSAEVAREGLPIPGIWKPERTNEDGEVVLAIGAGEGLHLMAVGEAGALAVLEAADPDRLGREGPLSLRLSEPARLRLGMTPLADGSACAVQLRVAGYPKGVAVPVEIEAVLSWVATEESVLVPPGEWEVTLLGARPAAEVSGEGLGEPLSLAPGENLDLQVSFR